MKTERFDKRKPQGYTKLARKTSCPRCGTLLRVTGVFRNIRIKKCTNTYCSNSQ